MADEIDGTKAPHHGLFYMEKCLPDCRGSYKQQGPFAPQTLVDLRSSRRSQHQASVSQAASLWKRKRGKAGRAAAQ